MPTMKLGLRFCGTVGLFCLIILGTAAGLMMRHEGEVVHDEALTRAEMVTHFGGACWQYSRDTMPAEAERKRKQPLTKGGAFGMASKDSSEELGPEMAEYSFREASRNPLNLDNKATPSEEELLNRFEKDRT